MPRDPLLSAAELAEIADRLPDWSLDGATHLQRSLRFDGFSQAWGFCTRVALLAEQSDHHPEISCEYASVRIRMTTHDSGGLTRRDRDLALAIEQILAEMPRRPAPR